MTRSVYLDHHATTPLDRRVLEAMMPYLTSEFGNPSSTSHGWGLRARRAVEEARESVAALVGARAGEIVFTAGATEANNLAIKGFVRVKGGGHLVSTALEHPSVTASIEALTRDGCSATFVSPESDGIVSADAVREVLREDTCMVSVCVANGEIGTLQPLAEIARVARDRGVCVHTDATQAVGKIPVDVNALGCDLLALSAHKFYGPKGVGALVVRNDIKLEPLVSGGGQEHGLRPGTLNVPGIVGLGAIARIRGNEMVEEADRLADLRDRLWQGIRKRVKDAVQNGHPRHRLPGSLNVAFPGMPAERLLADLDRFGLSAGSACHSGKTEASPVLTAIGLSPELATCTVRFGLGKDTTEDDVEALLARLDSVVRRLRGAAAATPD